MIKISHPKPSPSSSSSLLPTQVEPFLFFLFWQGARQSLLISVGSSFLAQVSSMVDSLAFPLHSARVGARRSFAKSVGSYFHALIFLERRQDSSYKREKQARRLCVSWGSSANYVSTLEGAAKLLSKPMAIKHTVVNRASITRCATFEEIEAEKSVVEKVARERMEKAIEMVRSNFHAARTGRANPALLDRVEVEYYGTPVLLKSIAQISAPDPSSFLVQPFDKSSLKVIEKAIVGSNLGLTPNNDGDAIRIDVPQLTSDRRKEILKVVAKQAEEGKVAIRNIRRDAVKTYEKLEKEKKLSGDNVKDLSGDLQIIVDDYVKKIDSLLKQKEKELQKV